jgi:hypothetical protein
LPVNIDNSPQAASGPGFTRPEWPVSPDLLVTYIQEIVFEEFSGSAQALTKTA